MSPRIILLFSGKRKSGKDYLTDRLKDILGDQCEILKISQPIKSHWAEKKNLYLNDLLSSAMYKETYRMEMIKWSDEMRERDYGCFCRKACEAATDKPIWIVSDIRRKTDIQWFRETYGDIIYTIRIEADDQTRSERGFIFVKGVDDVASECDLDNFQDWNLVINNSAGKQVESQLNHITELVSVGYENLIADLHEA